MADGLAGADDVGFSFVQEKFKSCQNASLRMVCFQALMAQHRPECAAIRLAGLVDQNKAIREAALACSEGFLSRCIHAGERNTELRGLLNMLERFGDIDPPDIRDKTAVKLVANYASPQLLSELREDLVSNPQSPRGAMAIAVLTATAREEDVQFFEEAVRKGSSQLAGMVAAQLRFAARIEPEISTLWSPVAQACLDRMHAENANSEWVQYLTFLNVMHCQIPPKLLAALMEKRIGGSHFWSEMSSQISSSTSNEIASVACSLLRPPAMAERIRQWFRLREIKRAKYSGLGRSGLEDEIQLLSTAVLAISAGNLVNRSAMLERSLSFPFAKMRLEAALALGPTHKKAVKTVLKIPENELQIGNIVRALAFLYESKIPAAQNRVWDEISKPSNFSDINYFARDFLAEHMATEPHRSVKVMKNLIASRNSISIARVVIGALRIGAELPRDLQNQILELLRPLAMTTYKELREEINSIFKELGKG